MQIVNSDEVQWHSGPGHRNGDLRMKDLLTGNPGPGNFWFTLARVDEHYDAPPHRHNFEQVRFLLEGAFDFGPQSQQAGTIGYFCEGTPYTQTARGPSLTLLLQCEGPSRSRYMGVAELYRSVQGLRDAGGRFEHGHHIAPDGTERDGYEAAWEHLTGEPLTYAEPRFRAPVIMDVGAFGWRPVAGADGVAEKALGTFSERRLDLRFWKLDPEASFAWPGDPAASTLLFVLAGGGTAGDAAIGERFALKLDPGEPVVFAAGPDGLELYVVRLPD